MSNGKLVSEMLKEISNHDEAVMEILKERSEGYTPIQISKRLKRSYKDVKLSIHRLKIGGHVKNYPWYGRVCLVEFDFLPQLMNKRPNEYAESYREIDEKLTTITKQRDELAEKLQLAYDLLLISGWDDCYAKDIRSITGLLSTIKEQKDEQ